jgi:pyruvate dehydrogenase E1 component beta subunit
VEVEVIDPRTLSPLDTTAICESVRRTKRLVIVQEAPAPASFASEVSAVVAEHAIDFLDGPIKRVTGAFTPLPFGPLEDALIPGVSDIVTAIREVL